MKSRRESRRGRDAPPEIPPWWSNGVRPRMAGTDVAERSGYQRPDAVSSGRYHDGGYPVPPSTEQYVADAHTTDEWPESEYPPEEYSGTWPADPVYEQDADHGYADPPTEDLTGPPPDLPQQEMPAGNWINGHSHGDPVWVPDHRPAAPDAMRPPEARPSTDPADATSASLPAPASRPAAPPAPAASTSELAAMRPADQESARVRTTVDRPVAALRQVGLDEARQLAECFAMDYVSCDEDDPERRAEALAPYLSRRADAMLGWPGERAGVGRQRAIHARAGECLEQGRWVTIDVRVLIEVYERCGDAPEANSARHRTGLPPGALWSAVPPAEAPGWAVCMTVWQRLGIPVRRHDFGHLVVELFTVSDPEADREGATQ